MTTLVWGWAGIWLAMRLWLEWKVDTQWLPGAGDIREDWTDWASPPPNALTADGERLWRTRYRVTVLGFTGWLALATLWLAL